MSKYSSVEGILTGVVAYVIGAYVFKRYIEPRVLNG